jgi:uncharacterized protein
VPNLPIQFGGSHDCSKGSCTTSYVATPTVFSEQRWYPQAKRLVRIRSSAEFEAGSFPATTRQPMNMVEPRKSTTNPAIDRMAPTLRPKRKNAGVQKWRNLLFLHWTVPVEVLRRAVPASLEIDTFQDQAFLGIVPFAMQSIRPSWWKLTQGFDFLESNLRTYVYRNGQPGVYFFSLDAANWLAVQVARWGWSLPYFHARMAMNEQDGHTHYESHRIGQRADLAVTYAPGARLGPSSPNTIEFFLLERYLLFVERGGAVHVGQVHHAPYEAYEATVFHLQESIMEAAGFPPVTRPPDNIHYCPGVDVEVFALQKQA